MPDAEMPVKTCFAVNSGIFARMANRKPHRQQKAAKNGVVCFWVHLIKLIRLDPLPENKYALVFCRQSLACVQYGVDTMPGRFSPAFLISSRESFTLLSCGQFSEL